MSSLWRFIIPRPYDRIAYSSETLPWFIFLNTIAYAGLFLLAYLTRRPTPRLIRVALLPPVILINLYCAFSYRWPNPGQNVFNWGQGVVVFVVIGKCLEFALYPYGVLKHGETIPGQISRSSGLAEAGELVINLRGVGLQWSRGTHIPPPTRSHLPGPFLRQTLTHFILTALKYDLCETTLKCFPRIGEMDGGIFYSELSPVPRYMVSTFLCILVGACVLAGVEAYYDITCFIAVGIFKALPSAWPPILGNPWMATSLRDLWGRQWHQALRHTFIVYGGYPGYWVAGRVGFVLGTFFASGLFHELAAYAMGEGLKWEPLVFFVAQGVLVLGEVFFKQLTGKSVRGWAGRVWVYVAIVGLGQPMVDSWVKRAMGVAVIFPTAWSPSRFVLRALGISPP